VRRRPYSHGNGIKDARNGVWEYRCKESRRVANPILIQEGRGKIQP
jgi:hypothetical protein